jgi:uncharacterized protein YndB with AHSA1/START domain
MAAGLEVGSKQGDMSEQTPYEVKQKVFINASPERVYDAFATAEGLDAWFTRGARVDPRPGGEMFFKWVEWGAERDINLEEMGRVVEARRPERFVFQWGSPGRETTVEVDLEAREGGTLLRLREFGFHSLRGFIDNAGGWGQALTLVKFWLEHRIAINR